MEGRQVKTWQLFVLLCLVLLAANYYSREFVVTRASQEVLFRGRLDTLGVENQWRMYQRMEVWSYLLAPVVLWVEIAFIALLVQLALLLGRVEVPFARMFRVTAVAQVASVGAIITGLIYRAGLEPSQVSPANYFTSPGALLGQVTVFDLLWYLLLFIGLQRTAGVRRRGAVLVTVGLFIGFNAFDWALTAYLAQLGM